MPLSLLLALAAVQQSPARPELGPSPFVELPRFAVEELSYRGAFRLPGDTFGASSLNYSEGPIAYDAVAHSLFIVGHDHHQAIAEFLVPPLVESTVLGDLNVAAAPLQPFVTVLDRTTGGNPEGLNQIGGLFVAHHPGGRSLVVNAYEYYDAPADNTLSTLVVRDANDMAGSTVEGFTRFEGGAGHTSGWISPVPDAWRRPLGASHLVGASSGLPIIGRWSVGPSAFGFEPRQLIDGLDGPPLGPVPTRRLLDFSLTHPLESDLHNVSGTNDTWTHLSRVVYGFIAPGSRTYVTLGHSGGHASGVCYACVQDDGNLCGGYCPQDPQDVELRYWLWDVRDLVQVGRGERAAHDVRPYATGEFPAVFPASELGGGAFDPASGLLFLTLQRADTEQGEFSNPPVVVVYSL